MMKKTICLMALTALAMASTTIGCGDSGTGTGGSGGSGDGGSPTAGGGDEGGAPPGLVNGCDLASAEDQTAAEVVDIDWKNPLGTTCIRVAAGTVVNWNVTAPNTFGAHPLAGGDANSGSESGPITSSDQTGATAAVTFATAGEFPFFCEIHLSTMQGVIYVE